MLCTRPIFKRYIVVNVYQNSIDICPLCAAFRLYQVFLKHAFTRIWGNNLSLLICYITTSHDRQAQVLYRDHAKPVSVSCVAKVWHTGKVSAKLGSPVGGRMKVMILLGRQVDNGIVQDSLAGPLGSALGQVGDSSWTEKCSQGIVDTLHLLHEVPPHWSTVHHSAICRRYLHMFMHVCVCVFWHVNTL